MARNKSGFNDLNKLLKGIEQKAQEASGDVELGELLTPNFMTTFSNFSNLNEFWGKSPFGVPASSEEFAEIEQDKLDVYVKENTRFSNWQEMLDKAGVVYFENKLKF